MNDSEDDWGGWGGVLRRKGVMVIFTLVPISSMSWCHVLIGCWNFKMVFVGVIKWGPTFCGCDTWCVVC